MVALCFHVKEGIWLGGLCRTPRMPSLAVHLLSSCLRGKLVKRRHSLVHGLSSPGLEARG